MKENFKIVYPFFIIIILLVLVVFQMDRTIKVAAARSQLHANTHQISKAIQQNLAQASVDLMYLASQANTKELLTGQNEKSTPPLCEIYKSFAETHKLYSQIRLLDVTGFEVVRIDYKNGKASRVPNNKLQNKSDRYYFSEAEKLKPGEIYQSPFDLNVEHAKIERPYLPTIRFITPVTNSPRNIIGYVILNFDARSMLDEFRQITKAMPGQFFILNKDGYYLFSSDPSQNWGFMFNRTDLTFAHQNPGVWNLINQTNTSEISFKNKYFLVERICHNRQCDLSHHNEYLATNAIDMPWIVVSEIYKSNIFGASKWLYYWPYIITILLALIAFLALKVSSKLSASISELSARQQLLQKSNQRFESLLQSMPDGLLVVDDIGRVETMNSVSEKIFETSKAEVLHKPIQTLLPKALITKLDSMNKETFYECLVSSNVFHNEVYEYQIDKNIKKYLEISLDPFMFEDNKLAIILVKDVSDRIQTQENLRQTQKLEALGLLTGGIAHDFNNFLGIILGNLELLKMESAGNDRSQRRIDSILKTTSRAAGLTQKLLTISRKTPLQIKCVNINELIEDVIDILRRTIKGRITISCHSEPALPLMSVDPNELTSSLINLAINSRDAMPEGGCISINVRKIALNSEYCKSTALSSNLEPGDFILIEVSDTGIGIPKKLINKVLEPFFTTKDKTKGTGLGLAMTYGFIKQSKGEMKLYSEEGKGTSIHLYLPVCKSPTDSSEPTSRNFSADVSNYRVLIVDDEQDLADTLSDFLSRKGMICDVAYSGEDAWKNLSNTPYDLLISDVVMPGKVDGLGLYELIKAEKPYIKVILSSGFSDDICSKSENLGSELVFIKKPYSQQEIMDVILKVLQS